MESRSDIALPSFVRATSPPLWKPKAGDGELHSLFRRYFRPVFHFFLNRGIPREECLDLAQETFLRACRSLDGFRAEASLQTWLFRIATNLWRNEVRRRMAEKREGWEVSLEGVCAAGETIAADHCLTGWAEPSGPLDGMLESERRKLLRTALEELPPQMRRCVLLRIDQNLKYREIAGVMRISIDTVKSQISQAKDRLERKLEGYFDAIDC
jgi:RNA polymerase sigma-70 factor (ECF subfamily)